MSLLGMSCVVLCHSRRSDLLYSAQPLALCLRAEVKELSHLIENFVQYKWCWLTHMDP